MADRFPLILNTSTNQIQEIPNGDQLDLTGNNLANAGIITATTFSGNLTGNVTGNINGNLTGTLQTAAQPNITSLGTLSSLNVSGNASIGGVLTYEDVTSVDSIGIITARAGFHCSTDGVGNGIKVGAGSDLIIQHNGTNSFIDNNTGDLYIQTTGSGDDILIESADDVTIKVSGSETAIQATGDGAVELYYDGSKKFETTSSGAKITGTATATSSLIVGSGNDLQFTRSGGNTEIQNYSGTLLFANASSNLNNVSIRGRADENSIVCIPDGAVKLYYDNAQKFETTSLGAQVTGRLNVSGNFEQDDNVKANWGNSHDLQIYHDGSLSWIKNNTGKLVVRSDTYQFGSSDGSHRYIDIPDNEQGVSLYYDDDKKLETTSTGVTVTGDLTFSDSVANDIHLRGGKIYGDDGALPAFTIQNTSGNANHAKIIIGANNSDNGGIEFYGAGSSSSDLKMTIRGNTDTVEIPDNHKFVCGDGSDLQIFHNGTHSYIQESGAGALQIRGANLILDNADGSKRYIDCNDGGSVELYYDNSQKMLTSSTGINVNFRIAASGDENTYVNLGNPADQWQFYTGGVDRLFITGGPSDGGTVQVRGDNNKLQIGASQDLQIFHNGTNSYIDNKTGNLYIRANTDGDVGGDIHIRAKSGENSLSCLDDGAVKLYFDNSEKLATASAGVTVTGTLTATSFAGDGSALTGLGGGVPSGCILLWSGAANAIPTGYVLCDGNNSTPNLSGRFVVGYHASNGDYDVGDTGGAETVTLTEAQMPAHNHHSYIANDGSGPFGSVRASGNNNAQGAVATTTKGGGNAHENRPPYYSLCYIMKT